MIFVAGGTGALGQVVVRLLMARGERVRVLTRDPKRAERLPAGVDVVTGDLRAPRDLRAALTDCSTVISAVHGFVGTDRTSPEEIDREGNRALIAAAREAGVTKFVLCSVHGAGADHPMSLHRAKFAAEEILRASGLAFTIVRPTAFYETWCEVIGGSLSKGHALVFGPGRNPINFVSVRDVAALVVMAATDPALAGETVDIGGRENLDFVTFAAKLIEASGKPARIKHIPLPVLRVMAVLARPFAPTFARQARAAVVMNTTDFTFDASVRDRFPALPSTVLGEVLAARPRI